MATDGLTLHTVTQAINGGWNAATDAVTGAATALKEEMAKAATFAEEILTQTTLTESEGTYTIDGPFASKFTFTWRELLMIGGIVSSVIFATIAFFTGSLLTGTIYLIYTVLLIFGAYWLSEWSKNLTAEQILEKAKAGGVAAINILKAIVGQFTGVLEGHGEVYAAQVAELKRLDNVMDANVQKLSGTAAVLAREAGAIPACLAPFTKQMGDALKESSGLRKDLRAQTDRLSAQNRQLQEQITHGQHELGLLQGQVLALRQILGGFQTERAHLARIGEGISKNHVKLQQEVNRLSSALDRVLPRRTDTNAPHVTFASNLTTILGQSARPITVSV